MKREHRECRAQEPIRSEYVIQKLKEDTINTWLSWRVVHSIPLTVNIHGLESIDPEKQEAIKDAILSKEVAKADEFKLHKYKRGSIPVYYKGWQEALESISE